MKAEIRNLKSERSPKAEFRTEDRTISSVSRPPRREAIRFSGFGFWILDFTVAPLLWLALALIVLVAAPSARAQRAFTARFSTNQYGNVTFAANTLMTLTNAANAAAVQAGTDPTAANLTNNNWTMQFVDADSDTTTTNSSRATLTLPIGATVLRYV